jgi:hypothetical protein
MAGKFTNLRYDPEAYDEEVLRSTNPLLYKLDPNYAINCNSCFAPYGPRGGHDNSEVVGDKIDVDSILKGLHKINSKSNKHQMPEPLSHYPLQLPNECPTALETQHSRYTHPSFDIRGLNVADMRLGYPLHDPQCQIFENFEVNTRLQAKDDHKTIWQIPFNQRDLLPTERLGKVKNCAITLNCNYAPYVPNSL